MDEARLIPETLSLYLGRWRLFQTSDALKTCEQSEARKRANQNPKQCVLVIISAGEYGHKEVISLIDGDRESKESWRELSLGLKRREELLAF